MAQGGKVGVFTRGKRLRRAALAALMLTSSLGTVGAATPAQAQEAARSFDIPAQPLATAVTSTPPEGRSGRSRALCTWSSTVWRNSPTVAFHALQTAAAGRASSCAGPSTSGSSASGSAGTHRVSERSSSRFCAASSCC